MARANATFAELTPPGAGAIAVVAIRGVDAWPIVSRLFQPAGPFLRPDVVAPAGTIRFGHVRGNGLEDEAILVVKPGASPPWIELHMHGSRAGLEWILELLRNAGASACSAADFLPNPPMKWTRLAAQSLALARTERVAAILLDQYNGAFSGALDRIRHSLQSGQTDDARRVLNDLQSNTLLGQRLLEPWKVVLAGPPNVGKSSLLNALAGYQRSIVTPQPGTTRDCVSVVTAFEGWPVELIDTAGLHSADDELEQEGIARSREMAQQADLALWIYDATSFEPIGPSQEITSRKCLHVINKCDLEPQRRLDDVMDAFRVSARTGAGIDALGSRIARELAPVAPPAGSAVPFHSECSDLLTRLAALVDSGLLAEAGQMLASAGA